MRKVAAYSLEATAKEKGDDLPGQVSACIDAWLESKGRLHVGPGATSLEMPDGRFADIEGDTIELQEGLLRDLVLTEPTPVGQFRTTFVMAAGGGRVAIGCSLEVGALGEQISPMFYDARRPKFIKSIIDLPITWTFGGREIPKRPLAFTGTEGGDAFVELVWSGGRTLPVVTVSNDHGFVLHPGIAEAIADELLGLSIVVELDSDASWRVTKRKGSQWSCFGGAIRVYWPGLRPDQSPFQHHLWTPRRLLVNVPSSDAAASRIRRQLRARVLGLSAFSIWEPPLARQLRRAQRQAEVEALKQSAKEAPDYQRVSEDLFARLASMEGDLAAVQEENDDLRRQLTNLQEALRYQRVQPDEVEPETVTPPASVEEAVLQAMEEHGSRLVWGADVDAGIGTVRPEAGPPDKLKLYLDRLAEMAEAMRMGPLGESVIAWLSARGVKCSGESETDRNSAAERQKRTWDDGSGQKQYFDSHLKPNEASPPDRCVRVYFDADHERGCVVIGWVGRHP